MGVSGLNLLATDYSAGAALKTGLLQDGGQGAGARHGSDSVNNLAQTDVIEQHEESAVNTKLVSKKVGSPTNIDGHTQQASGRATSSLGQSAGQEAVADYESYANNNQSQEAVADQKEKVSTNLDVDVLAKHPQGLYHHHGLYGHHGVHGSPSGKHPYGGPDSISVNLDDHQASSDQKAITDQDGAQVAKSNHGSKSVNNLAQNAITNQEEDISVNADVNVGGRGTAYGGPVLVSASDHTASGNLNAASAQTAAQTAISDNASVSINNLSQSNFTHQNEKVGVNTNVVV